jgi:hypothetical protein
MRQVERSRVAPGALQNGAEMLGTGRRVEHPAPFLPRRVVSQVLGVTAVQRRNPLMLVVLVELHDPTVHR